MSCSMASPMGREEGTTKTPVIDSPVFRRWSANFGTLFKSWVASPIHATPSNILPALGWTLVLPTVNPMVPETTLALWRVDR